MKYRRIILETGASNDLSGWLTTGPGESLDSESLPSTTQLGRTLCEGRLPCQAKALAAAGQFPGWPEHAIERWPNLSPLAYNQACQRQVN